MQRDTRNLHYWPTTPRVEGVSRAPQFDVSSLDRSWRRCETGLTLRPGAVAEEPLTRSRSPAVANADRAGAKVGASRGRGKQSRQGRESGQTSQASPAGPLKQHRVGPHAYARRSPRQCGGTASVGQAISACRSTGAEPKRPRNATT
jgi:hypothetical protein